ncbi:MAG: hypothetical protein QOI12_3574 [Alphaproteobacteria bacterium]|jgi:Flp pilus assembly pilin Flp|nr:hypothetical protein [Alphaproteobacteria bacterium]
MFKKIISKLKCRLDRIFHSYAEHRFRLLQREDGVAAVEFALVAAPFLALLFAIMETALVFFAGQVLETVTSDAGRLILTGQAQSLSQDSFKDKVCPQAGLFGLFDCANMSVDVRAYTTFAGASLTPPPMDANGKTADTYQPGTACDIVVARVFYSFPVYVNLLGFNLADATTAGKRRLAATSVFRNEPFTGPPC